MHPRLLTQGNQLFQTVVMVQRKCDRNLVILVLLQLLLQIVNDAYHLHAPVLGADRHMVVQNPIDDITPFRVFAHPSDISLRRARIPDQQNML